MVAYGTSAPEMVVSGLAAAQDDLDIGVGNVIGSNVANISLVLAAATLITVVPVDSKVLRREAPLSVASVIVFALFVQGELERWEGYVLLGMLFVALAWIMLTSRGADPLGDEIAGFAAGR